VSKYTTPDFSSVALITIDMQQDTLDDQPFEVPGTSALLSTLKRLLESFREAGKPMIHIVRIYQPYDQMFISVGESRSSKELS